LPARTSTGLSHDGRARSGYAPNHIYLRIRLRSKCLVGAIREFPSLSWKEFFRPIPFLGKQKKKNVPKGTLFFFGAGEGNSQLLPMVASAVLRLPVQQAWTAACSNVHRTFSRLSRPFGSDSQLPTEQKQTPLIKECLFLLERVRGIGPPYPAWEDCNCQARTLWLQWLWLMLNNIDVLIDVNY
jgi:hypothetical protein